MWQFDSTGHGCAILGIAVTGWSGMVEICGVCEGSGLRIVEENGRQVARPCECRIERRAARMLERARIPKRYKHCTLDSYESGFRGADRTLSAAHLLARKFVEGYPETEGQGLLLTGSVGVGKTHLAIAMLQALISDRGAVGLFYDYRDLLKEVQNTYNKQVAITELDVLSPIFDVEILVLDELGASRPSDWVSDTVAHILNTRYNERKTTIMTSNFMNLTQSAGPPKELGKSEKRETLGDRIGERMWSRLQEMCVAVDMQGADFRQGVKRATFA
jgi:DNA replication protein DnaC